MLLIVVPNLLPYSNNHQQYTINIIVIYVILNVITGKAN